MNKNIFDNYGQVAEMNKICCAYITFNQTEGYERALEVTKRENWAFKILTQHPKFTPAPAPQDIKWENKHEKKLDVAKKMKQTVYLLIFIAFVYFFGVGDVAQDAVAA
jgi:hypothetical protein